MDKDFRQRCRKLRYTLLHLLLIVGGATGLKDLTINVPAMVRSGDTVTLSCHYDLEGLSLYTIQWFLEDVEFYRYVPDRQPHYNTFNVTDIRVNISKSNSHDVTLVDVSRNLTGMYKCEVSAGSPSYHTMIQKARMEVVATAPRDLEALAFVGKRGGKHDVGRCSSVSDAPKTDPVIRTEKERIGVGETLRVNCTSGNSRPAPAVTWKLNGDSIKDDYRYKIWHYQNSHDDDTQSTASFIEFRATDDMFRKGRLHLRCTAFISDVYRKSADIEITEDVPRIASITGESPPYDIRANGCAGRNWLWLGNRGAAIIMTTVAATLFLMMTSLTMTVPSITNVLPRSNEPTAVSR